MFAGWLAREKIAAGGFSVRGEACERELRDSLGRLVRNIVSPGVGVAFPISRTLTTGRPDDISDNVASLSDRVTRTIRSLCARFAGLRDLAHYCRRREPTHAQTLMGHRRHRLNYDKRLKRMFAQGRPVSF